MHTLVISRLIVD